VLASVKLHPLPPSAFYNTFTAYGDGFVEINEKRFESSILVLPEGAIIPWPVARFESLAPEHFEQILALAPEVVVFGSGERLRFLPPRLARALTNHQIGIEAMDLRAACRTFNILMAEGRRVVAALLFETLEERS